MLVLIPAYNEREKIGRVVKSLPSFVDVKLVVDDGSTDGTNVEAESAGALVLRHERNRGVGAAIRTGCEFAKASQADIVVFMAGDGQSDPSDLLRLVDPISIGKCDFVQGSRFHSRPKAMPWIRFIGNRLLLLMFRMIVRESITDYTSGYRAISAGCLKKLDIPEDRFDRYEMEPWILIQATRNLNWTEIPVRCIYGRNTSKMKPLIDWARFVPPLLAYAWASLEESIRGKT